jgi:hypothetical protein
MGAINAGREKGTTADARTCRRVRERLCAGSSAGGAASRSDQTDRTHRRMAEALGHVESCAACADFARRLDLARQALGFAQSPPWALQPDPGFPARVVALIERPAELLGWAAFRTLPAALGLALALAWLGFTSQPPAAAPALTALEEPSPSTDQLIAWSAGSPEVWP